MDDLEYIGRKAKKTLEVLFRKTKEKIDQIVEKSETEGQVNAELEKQTRNLRLIGFAHTDNLGKEILLKYFEAEKPAKILLEGNKKTFENFSKSEVLSKFSRIKNREARNTIQNFFGQFHLHEYDACLEYCKNHDECSFHLIDSDSSPLIIEHNIYSKLEEVAETISTEEDAEEVIEFIKDQTDNVYQLIFEALVLPPGMLRNLACKVVLFKSQAELEKIDFGKRDAYMAEKIRELYLPEEKTIVVVGGMHILDDSKERTLYSKIKDLNPIRTLSSVVLEEIEYFRE